MKITYSIWQGSLYKGTLTATNMKEVIATVKDLNEGNTSVKFDHMVTNISQVAQWNSTQTQTTLVYMLTVSV